MIPGRIQSFPGPRICAPLLSKACFLSLDGVRLGIKLHDARFVVVRRPFFSFPHARSSRSYLFLHFGPVPFLHITFLVLDSGHHSILTHSFAFFPNIHSLEMPCVKKSSVLTAATAALSSIYSSTVPAATAVAQTSVSATSIGLATGAPTPASSATAGNATGVPTVSSSAASATSSATAGSGGNTTYAGVNIAGFDFGCDTNGQCTVDGITNIATGTGPAQMQHFTSNDNMNMFRLSVGWQYLTNDVVGGDLDATNFANYNDLMTSCLATGAKCILDIHNYARWNGEVIGQGGPTNDQFAALWTSLATQYSNNTNVVFGIMNEPHDLTVSTWAQTVQAAVTAIRAVAPDHMVLMPGSSYSSAQTLSTEAGPDLLNVTNPDGSTTNLLFDVHK